jgi:hypothetical protein
VSNCRVTSQTPHKKHKTPTKHHHRGGWAARPSSGVDLMNPCCLRCGRPCAYSFRCRLRSDLTANSLTPMGLGGNEKIPPRRFHTVGIVWEIHRHRTATQLPPQTSSLWCFVSLPYSVDSINRPSPTHGQPSAGVGRGRLRWVLYELLN